MQFKYFYFSFSVLNPLGKWAYIFPCWFEVFFAASATSFSLSFPFLALCISLVEVAVNAELLVWFLPHHKWTVIFSLTSEASGPWLQNKGMLLWDWQREEHSEGDHTPPGWSWGQFYPLGVSIFYFVCC